MSANLLELAGVHTHIGAYHILHGVDLIVPRGELTMLLGRESGVAQVDMLTLAASAAAGSLTSRLPDAGAVRPLADQVAELERRAIAAAMASAKGNKVAAAKMLGISRAKLYERLANDGQIYVFNSGKVSEPKTF